MKQMLLTSLILVLCFVPVLAYGDSVDEEITLHEEEFQPADLQAIDGFSPHSIPIGWWYSFSRAQGETTFTGLSPQKPESEVKYRYPQDGDSGRLSLQMREPTDLSGYDGFEIHLRSNTSAEVGLALNLTCDEVSDAFMNLDPPIQCMPEGVAVRVPFSSFRAQAAAEGQTDPSCLPGLECFMELVFLVGQDGVELTVESVQVYRPPAQESVAVQPGALATPGIDGYAVILEVDDHPGEGSDIITGYANRNRIVDALLAKGWTEENIFVLLDHDVTVSAIEGAMDWLMERVTGEDLVFIYASGHGNYLRETVGLGWAFPPLWRALPTDRKVFVVNSCGAGQITASAMYGEFIEPELQAEHSDQLTAGLAIAGCAHDEQGMSGSIGMGLPILGGYMTFFLHGALNDLSLDTDGDLLVSVEEAFVGTYSRTRAFYEEELTKIFTYCTLMPEPVLEQLRAMVEYDYPHPELIDGYPGELILDLRYYREDARE